MKFLPIGIPGGAFPLLLFADILKGDLSSHLMDVPHA